MRMSLLVRLRPMTKCVQTSRTIFILSKHTNPFLISQPINHARCFSVAGIFTSISNSAPVAHFQDGLIQLHDLSGLPWWATIIMSTVLLRTLITLPLTIYQHKITARLELIAAEMPDIVKELKLETVVAKKRFQWTDAQARVVYNRSMKKQWNKLIVRDNCHPMKTFIVLWGQIPLWVVQSIALRNLLGQLPDPSSLQAQLTFTELTLGGFAWIPNLTEVDSSFILPVSLGLLNLAIIELQTMTRTKRGRSRLQIYATNFFRFFSVAMVPISASVPAALSLYWTASSAYGLAQNILLLSPGFRRATAIPKTNSELTHPFSHIHNTSEARLIAIQDKVMMLINKKPTSST